MPAQLFVSNGHVTNYVAQGEGSNVVFLHGWGGSLTSFSFAAARLAKYGYATLNLDWAGWGDSGEPIGIWGVKEYCDQLIGLLVHLGIERASFVGHSFGGRVGIYLASHYPERVDKLVLVDSAGVKPRRSLLYHIKVWRFKYLKRRNRDTSHLGSIDYRSLSENMKKTFVRVVNEDLTCQLPLIQSPTLLIWGTCDKETPLYMARKINRLIPDSGIVKLGGCGHYSYLEKPEIFMRVLTSFLT